MDEFLFSKIIFSKNKISLSQVKSFPLDKKISSVGIPLGKKKKQKINLLFPHLFKPSR